jgi:hypothetical protein
LKHKDLPKLHGITIQKIILFGVTTMRVSPCKNPFAVQLNNKNNNNNNQEIY